MNKIQKIVTLIALILVTGCSGSYKGSVAKCSLDKVSKLTHKKTGETFSFRHKDITNIRLGVGCTPTKFTIVTLKGKTMVLSSDTEKDYTFYVYTEYNFDKKPKEK